MSQVQISDSDREIRVEFNYGPLGGDGMLGGIKSPLCLDTQGASDRLTRTCQIPARIDYRSAVSDGRLDSILCILPSGIVIVRDL